MSINNHWRNKQAGDNLIWQEFQCLEFLKKYPTVSWQWHSNIKGHFYNLCCKELTISNQGTGFIIINHPIRVSPSIFIESIKKILTSKIDVVYLAVNRFEFAVDYSHALSDYPDQISDCIDLIVSKCNPNFRRLYWPEQVDGNHFVGVHGLDVFVYENNN